MLREICRVSHSFLNSAPSVAQAVSAFCLGLLLAPTSKGALVFFVGLFVYELAVYTTSRIGHGAGLWAFWPRAVILLAGAIGYVAGRWLIGRL